LSDDIFFLFGMDIGVHIRILLADHVIVGKAAKMPKSTNQQKSV